MLEDEKRYWLNLKELVQAEYAENKIKQQAILKEIDDMQKDLTPKFRTGRLVTWVYAWEELERIYAFGDYENAISRIKQKWQSKLEAERRFSEKGLVFFRPSLKKRLDLKILKECSTNERRELVDLVLTRLEYASTNGLGITNIKRIILTELNNSGINKDNLQAIERCLVNTQDNNECLTATNLLETIKMVERFGDERDRSRLANLSWYQEDQWLLDITIPAVPANKLPLISLRTLEHTAKLKSRWFQFDKRRQLKLSEKISCELILINKYFKTTKESFPLYNIQDFDNEKFPEQLNNIKSNFSMLEATFVSVFESANQDKKGFFKFFYRGSSRMLTQWQEEILRLNNEVLMFASNQLKSICDTYKQWVDHERTKETKDLHKKDIILNHIVNLKKFIKDLFDKLSQRIEAQKVNLSGLSSESIKIAKCRIDALLQSTIEHIKNEHCASPGLAAETPDAELKEKLVSLEAGSLKILSDGSVIKDCELRVLITRNVLFDKIDKKVFCMSNQAEHQKILSHFKEYLLKSGTQILGEASKRYLEQALRYLKSAGEEELLQGMRSNIHQNKACFIDDSSRRFLERLLEMIGISEEEKLQRDKKRVSLKRLECNLTLKYFSELLQPFPPIVKRKFNTLLAAMVESKNPKYEEMKRQVSGWDMIEQIFSNDQPKLKRIIEDLEKTAQLKTDQANLVESMNRSQEKLFSMSGVSSAALPYLGGFFEAPAGRGSDQQSLDQYSTVFKF